MKPLAGLALLSFAFMCTAIGIGALYGPDRVADALFMSVAQLNATANLQATALRGDVAAVSWQLERDANARIAEAEERVSQLVYTGTVIGAREIDRTQQILEITAARLDSRVGEAIGTLDGFERDFNAISVPLAATAGQISDAAPLWLDCTSNPDCAFNRYQGTSKALENSARTVQMFLPTIAGNVSRTTSSVAEITADAARLTDHLTAPKSFWGHFKDGLFAAAGIGRLLR